MTLQLEDDEIVVLNTAPPAANKLFADEIVSVEIKRKTKKDFNVRYIKY